VHPRGFTFSRGGGSKGGQSKGRGRKENQKGAAASTIRQRKKNQGRDLRTSVNLAAMGSIVGEQGYHLTENKGGSEELQERSPLFIEAFKRKQKSKRGG